jgi:hypothetical protein
MTPRAQSLFCDQILTLGPKVKETGSNLASLLMASRDLTKSSPTATPLKRKHGKSAPDFLRVTPIGELLSLKRISPRWEGNPASPADAQC